MSIHKEPNWRWRRAVVLVDSQARPTRGDDRWVERAWRFLRRKRAATPARLPALERAYPDIYFANKMYEEENEYRWMVEASLCTNTTIEKIESDQGFDNGEVRAYASLFFDVQDKLHSQIFVANHILMAARRNKSADERSPDFIPKMVALTLGYQSLLDLKRTGSESAVLRKFMRVERENKLSQAGVESSYTLPVNKYSAEAILQLCQQADSDADEHGRSGKEALLLSVEELLQSVHFKRRTASDSILSADGSEPRALENSDIEFGDETSSA